MEGGRCDSAESTDKLRSPYYRGLGGRVATHISATYPRKSNMAGEKDQTANAGVDFELVL